MEQRRPTFDPNVHTNYSVPQINLFHKTVSHNLLHLKLYNNTTS